MKKFNRYDILHRRGLDQRMASGKSMGKRTLRLALPLVALSGFALSTVGCSDDTVEPTPTTFTVTVENVSQPMTLSTDRANGIVPLSPGTYAIYDGDNPIFTSGGMADAALEAIAEDGVTDASVAQLAADMDVSASGAFKNVDGPILPDKPATFTFTARPGDKLQLATMFVQSNDWFYAFGDGGLDLFDDDMPISGDVTSYLVLYDAGTEEDTAPGTGPDQKPAQMETEVNVGPADDNTTIRMASEDGFDIPGTSSVIRVTISSSN